MEVKKAYRHATIYVTSKCNLFCGRCYWKHAPDKWNGYTMTWEQFLSVCNSLKRECSLPLTEITFSGGEPSLWKHLAEATALIKRDKLAKTIRVVTNAVDRNTEDYGPTDIIQVSDYGALNRADYRRLKKTSNAKVKTQKVVHLDWPFLDWDKVKNPLPATCNCALLAFCGDEVYQCGMGSTMDQNGTPVKEAGWYEKFINSNPYTSELCKKCLSNQKVRKHYAIPPTVEVSVWDCAVGKDFEVSPTSGYYLRKLYNFIRRIGS